MTDSFDALEAELEAVRPREPSPQLQQRIAKRLEQASSACRKRVAWSVVCAGGIAAGVSLAILLGRGHDSEHPEEPTIVTPGPLAPAPAVVDDRWPTALAYQEALAESPEAFEALLDKHARLWSVASGPVPRANPWTAASFLSDTTGEQ